MKLHILGCGGGIGGRERLTTSLWLDTDILLDAGTGLSDLDIGQLHAIDHVFLTHSHLDHIAGLALLLDAVAGKRAGPVTVHATEKVISSLQEHLFNWVLWPDFSRITNEDMPILCWAPIVPGKTVELNGRSITAYRVNHTVDAVGYWVRNSDAGFLFTGDMSSTPDLWATMVQETKLVKVIVDCSFSNADIALANKSKHFCPSTLVEDIRTMPDSIEFFIYHLKPGQEDLIMEELRVAGGKRTFKALRRGDCFVF